MEGGAPGRQGLSSDLRTGKEAGRGHSPASSYAAAQPTEADARGDSGIIRSAPPTSLVLCDRASPQATSQARGMLSVSRVLPIQTASSASAGPVTRCSSTRLAASATLM
jgi:hypothetical protein